MLISSALAASLLVLIQAVPPASEPAAPLAPEAATEPAADVDTEASTQISDKADAQDEDKVICRRTAITGSRFKKRLCGTRKEWEALRSQSKETTQDMQRSGRGLEPDRSR